MVQFLAQLAPGAAALTDFYVVPPANSIADGKVIVANRSGNDTFRLSLARGGAADAAGQYLFYDMPVLGADTFTAPFSIAAGAGDVIRVYSTNGNLTFTLFGASQ